MKFLFTLKINYFHGVTFHSNFINKDTCYIVENLNFLFLLLCATNYIFFKNLKTLCVDKLKIAHKNQIPMTADAQQKVRRHAISSKG